MIHVLADQNLYKIEEFIPPQVKLSLYNPAEGVPDPTGMDALLVRTVTFLNEDSMPEIPKSLKFLGTGSSGTDHIDNEYFEGSGITLADANGCNARTVAEYVMMSLLLWRDNQESLEKIGPVGVVGVGKAGSAVVQLLQDFGIECVQYDPPREQRDSGFESASLEEVLACDILTFHVPMSRKGSFPTYHWLNAEKLSGRHFKLIINTARGGVIDELAMMKAYVEGTIENYVLDVWENEPDFNTEVAKHAFIATPHIAGYSEQSKIDATMIVCDKMADFFGIKSAVTKYKNISKAVDLAHINYQLKEILLRLHPIKEYDAALRDLYHRPDKKFLFRNIRNEWPYRYEFQCLKIRGELLEKFSELRTLGISESK